MSKNSIAIIIPTLDRALGESVGQMALATTGCSVPVRTIVVEDTESRGFTKTVNRGIRLAHLQEDVCLLNDDVTWFQLGWLEIQRRALYAHKEYGLTGPSGDCGAVPINQGLLGGSGTETVPHISFWCVLLKREMLDELGLLDEEFIHYNSDSWYCVTMKRTGWKCLWVKSVFLVHKKHGSGKILSWRDHDIAVYRGRKNARARARARG